MKLESRWEERQWQWSGGRTERTRRSRLEPTRNTMKMVRVTASTPRHTALFSVMRLSPTCKAYSIGAQS